MSQAGSAAEASCQCLSAALAALPWVLREFRQHLRVLWWGVPWEPSVIPLAVIPRRPALHIIVPLQSPLFLAQPSSPHFLYVTYLPVPGLTLSAEFCVSKMLIES